MTILFFILSYIVSVVLCILLYRATKNINPELKVAAFIPIGNTVVLLVCGGVSLFYYISTENQFTHLYNKLFGD